jgi:hypothetical protein
LWFSTEDLYRGTRLPLIIHFKTLRRCHHRHQRAPLIIFSRFGDASEANDRRQNALRALSRQVLYPKPVFPTKSPNELRELKKAFEFFANRKGVVSRRRLGEVLQRLGQRRPKAAVATMYETALSRSACSQLDFRAWLEITHCQYAPSPPAGS